MQTDSQTGADMEAEQAPRGPNNGRLLEDGDFVLELAIFETGVPPEFRAWANVGGRPVDPSRVDLTVRLTRLGDRIDVIQFAPSDGFLRGDTVIYEPHSFTVTVDAAIDGRNHHWEYDSFEGRTTIGPEMSEALGIGTAIAGPAVLRESITVYGTVAPNRERVREVRARFDGAIQSVDASLGQRVSAGQRLARVESNESLRSYEITAPIAGTVTERTANAGEQTAGRRLFTIVDTTSVWAELSIFPQDRSRLRVGAPVAISLASGGETVEGSIAFVDLLARENQAVTARVVLGNADGRWPIGTYVTADVEVAEYEVPLAVRRTGLQSFRDFTVVYAKIGNEYEVRMLELGRQDDEWVEVLGGLESGTRYVSENSYILKADVEKSGASHDH